MSEPAPSRLATPATVEARKHESHRWKFYRAGGVDQVQLRDGRDLARLG